MYHSKVRQRFKAEIADNHADWKVFYDNDPTAENVDAESKWCRVKIETISARQTAIGGDKRFRYEGMMTVQLFIPVGAGTKDIEDFSEIIKSVFRSVASDEIKYLTPRTSYQGRDGSWWQENVICPFWAYE